MRHKYKEKILDYIVRNYFLTDVINDNDTVIVALSGGMDSMCLMDVFYKLDIEVDYHLKAIHVHHGIRGNEADRDLEFVKSYCKSMDIELIEAKVNTLDYARLNKLTIEEAARKLRYDEFEKCYKKISAENKNHNTYILVAHHEKDQVETILHNMIRGTGLRGIAGMNSQNDYIIRPFLNISKKEIERYVDTYDVPYVNDTSNEDTSFARNFIRKEVIDKLETINVQAYAHIVELARQVRDVNNFLDTESAKAYKKVLIKESASKIVIDLSKFRSKNSVIKAGVVRYIFDKLVGTLKDITKINVNDIIDMAEKEKGGHIDLPYNMTVDKKKNELIFTKNVKNISMSRRKKR